MNRHILLGGKSASLALLLVLTAPSLYPETESVSPPTFPREIRDVYALPIRGKLSVYSRQWIARESFDRKLSLMRHEAVYHKKFRHRRG